MINVHQIYYDENQLSQISSRCKPYFNTQVSQFMENQVIKDLYENKQIHDSEFFGVLSWRIESKNGINLNVLDRITTQHNLYSFNKIVGNRHPVMSLGSFHHPNFGYLFEKIIKNLGHDYSHIYNSAQLGLYQNAIIANRSIFLDYCENWLLPTMDFITYNTDEEFCKKLKENTNYAYYPPGVSEKLQLHTGTPWYQYHTFLCERLWSAYFVQNRDKIKLCLL